MDYCIVRPGGAVGSYGSLGEIQAFLEMHAAAGFYEIVEGRVGLRLPGYADPRWGVATKNRCGLVELIPDFWRQVDEPSGPPGSA